jgi:hypothetical protein
MLLMDKQNVCHVFAKTDLEQQPLGPLPPHVELENEFVSAENGGK